MADGHPHRAFTTDQECLELAASVTHPAWVKPRRTVVTSLLHWPRIFLRGSQLLLPAATVPSLTVLNPLLNPAIVDVRNSQDALSAHALIADYCIVLHRLLSSWRPS